MLTQVNQLLDVEKWEEFEGHLEILTNVVTYCLLLLTLLLKRKKRKKNRIHLPDFSVALLSGED